MRRRAIVECVGGKNAIRSGLKSCSILVGGLSPGSILLTVTNVSMTSRRRLTTALSVAATMHFARRGNAQHSIAVLSQATPATLTAALGVTSVAPPHYPAPTAPAHRP